MNYITPGVEPYVEQDPLLKLEKCIRVAYKSENKICEGSAEKLIRTILSHHHTSTLEHYRIKIFCSRDVADSVLQYNKATGKAFIRILDVGNDNYPATLVGNLRSFLDLIYSIHCETNTRWSIQDLLFTKFRFLFPENPDFPANVDAIDFGSVEYGGEADDYATFHIVTDRGVLAEITRHRSLSFTVESTRFCDYQKKGVSICRPEPYEWTPEDNGNFEVWVETIIFDWADNKPEYITKDGIITHAGICEIARLAKVQGIFEASMRNAEMAYNALKDLNEKPQSARSVLPNALKTELYVTGTFDAWRHFLSLRRASDAHPQIRIIANNIAAYLSEVYGVKYER